MKLSDTISGYPGFSCNRLVWFPEVTLSNIPIWNIVRLEASIRIGAWAKHAHQKNIGFTHEARQIAFSHRHKTKLFTLRIRKTIRRSCERFLSSSFVRDNPILISCVFNQPFKKTLTITSSYKVKRWRQFPKSEG